MVHVNNQTDSTANSPSEKTAPVNSKFAASNSLSNISLSEMQGLNKNVASTATDVPNLSIGGGHDSSLPRQTPLRGFDDGPWGQTVLEKASGLAGLVGFKTMDNLGGTAEKQAIAGLSGDDQKAYNKETKDHERWMATGDLSKPLAMPEHQKVADLVKNREKDVEEKVMDSMSPADQQKYLQAKKQYEGASADAFASGTKQPELPTEVQKFNEACAKEIGGVQTLDNGDPPNTTAASGAGERSPWLDYNPNKHIEDPSQSQMAADRKEIPWLDYYPPKQIQNPTQSGMKENGQIWLDFKVPDPYHLYS